MNPYGIGGNIIPEGYFKDSFAISVRGFEVFINDSIIKVEFSNEADIEMARLAATTLLNAWSLRNNIGLTIDWNSFWKPNTIGGKDISMSISDMIQLQDDIKVTRMTIADIKGVSRIISTLAYDSKEIMNDSKLAEESLGNDTLSNALRYFQESLTSNMPMVGMYKAIELIILAMPSNGNEAKRNFLAHLTGYDRKYIDDLMTSLQEQRHSREWLKLKKKFTELEDSKNILEELECRERIKNLIYAYAKLRVSALVSVRKKGCQVACPHATFSSDV